MIFGSGLGCMEHLKMSYIDGPACKIQFCAYCGKIVDKSVRGKKLTCNDECAALYQRKVWNIQYAEKMAKDPDFAKNQSAKQYARIKSDPEKLEAHRQAQKERRKMPNYQEAEKKGLKKYRSNPENKPKFAQRMRKYRDENPEIIAEIEARRNEKDLLERERLKLEEPDKYQQLREKEREYLRNLRAEKRLAELQKDLQKLVNNDE